MDTKDNIAVYRDALDRAYDEWRGLQEQEKQITIRKAQLKRTFQALCPLAFPEDQIAWDVNVLSLANAIRLVIQSSDRPITAIEMRGRLTDLGVDLSKYENPMASIHTAVNRMVDSEEMDYIQEDDKKKFTAGPELKPVPPPGPPPSDDPTQNAILNLLAGMREEKK